MLNVVMQSVVMLNAMAPGCGRVPQWLATCLLANVRLGHKQESVTNTIITLAIQGFKIIYCMSLGIGTK
jgi:hypothetical protein